MNEHILNQVKEAFASNTHLAVLFATKDGQCFAKIGDASHHSRSLIDTDFAGSPIKVYRDQLEALEASLKQAEQVVEETPVAPVEETPVAPAEETPVAPAEEVEGPKVKPLNKMNKDELQAECTRLEIEFTEEETKAELIAKIESKINPQ